MSIDKDGQSIKFSIIIPCFNEEKTLKNCVKHVLEIADKDLTLEIIIVDDGSSDKSLSISKQLESKHPQVLLFQHKINQGKGAAIRTGIQKATGDFVAIQDADLEYNPEQLKDLLVPLINDEADVVIGSRFNSSGPHRVLYFWHYMGNRFLTFVSNMLTDLNLTDMETCYKVFKRDAINDITIEENRFGFEPEIVSKVAHKRLRIFEMGISYYGRTYEEGKKIGVKDGIRAMYCIFHYNAPKLPIPIQFLIYLFIGGFSALINLLVFLGLYNIQGNVFIAAPIAFISAACVNYLLCISFLFRHNARWNPLAETFIYIIIVLVIGGVDLAITKLFLDSGISPGLSKISATLIGLILNFTGRRFGVFPEPSSGPWRPSSPEN